MATGREQRAAAGVFSCIPPELAIPRPDPVVIIHFAVMQFAEQATINDRLGGKELARIAALETDAAFHFRFFHGCFDGLAILP